MLIGGRWSFARVFFWYGAPWGLATPNNTTPLFVKPVLSHLVFTLRDECGDRFFSFFRSFVLSFFRSFFGQFSSIAPQYIFILCSFLIIARYFYTLRGEKKRGGTRKKKFERRDKKKALRREHTNGKERGAVFENTMVQQKRKGRPKVHTSFSRCVLYTLFLR